MTKTMSRDDIIKNAALSLAIDYHKMFDNGASVAAIQKSQVPAPAKPDSVVASAKVFLAFLRSK
jgi:hypothetical protein